jgi:8-oxo-dGTP diphosphatase
MGVTVASDARPRQKITRSLHSAQRVGDARTSSDPGYAATVSTDAQRWVRHDLVVADRLSDESSPGVPRIPASVGALIFDAAGRLLILKPSYKKGWTIPGGQIESGGESPWEACRRETLEECALEIEHGRLVCVDFLRPKPNRVGGVRFLFDCGSFTDERLGAIRLQEAEIEEHRLVELPEANALLSGPLRRRVSASLASKRCVYLEEGRSVPGAV